MEHTVTSAGHPQNNGKFERFHRTFRGEHVRGEVYLSYQDAVKRKGRWIEYYNQERLHAGITYLPPEEAFQGRKEERP
jgi:transposase InsO family protein